MLSPIGIEFDGADDCAFVGSSLHVQVAKRHHPWGAAVAHLLRHALLRFRGEVPAIELGQRAHDSVHEHALWRLVDVLGDGDELRSGFLNGQVDCHVVEPVARQAVNLVHDDVVHGITADRLQHALKLWACARSRRLASVDELGRHFRAKLFGFASTGLALCGD
ncbi:MAG: hypothetical protein QM774_00140 [Gordonia sp. (in: high G+C Gram-positive bacteria)]